jgi:hypothetical protein
MFRAVPLPIIRSFPLYIQHWYMSCSFDYSFQARPGWNCAYFVIPYCRVCFVQFFSGVSILTCFLCLFGIDEFYVHVTVHRNKFLFTKINRRTNFPNLFIFLSFVWSCLRAVSKLVWHIAVPNVQWKPPDDWQRNCPKHVEFLGENKFGKLVRLLVLLKRYTRDLYLTTHTHHSQEIGFYASGGVPTHNPRKRAATDRAATGIRHLSSEKCYWTLLRKAILIPDFYDVGWGTTIVCWA